MALVLPLSLAACSGPGEDGEEEDPLADTLGGKFDSLKNPTEHGRLFFGAPARETISADERYHQWLFQLEANGSLMIDLNKVGRVTDTVLYVYRDQGDGSWALVDKADDGQGDKMAGMWIDLEAGEYQLIVKGKKKTTRGEFEIDLACNGDGCPTKQCIFGPESIGDQYQNLVGFYDAQVATEWEHALTVDSELDEQERYWAEAQLVRSLSELGYEGVADWDMAFETVDGGEVNHTRLRDTLNGKTYFAFEYGLGDNSYGAIFEAGKRTPAALIHDGSIAECRAFHTIRR